MNYTIHTITERVIRGKVTFKKKKELESEDINEVNDTVKKLRLKRINAIIITNNSENSTETYKLQRNNYFKKVK